MTEKHDNKAQELEKALQTGEPCHNSELQPFTEVGEALSREASAEPAHLDASVAQKQRAQLLSMATSQPSAPAPQKEPRTSRFDWKGLFRTRLFVMGGGFALVAAVLVLAVVFQSSHVSAPQSGVSIAQLLIPEAHAADAFVVVPQKQDAAGIDVATAFDVTAKSAIDTKTLQQHLVVVPAVATDGSAPTPVAVTIQPKTDTTFVVIPNAPLDPATVYNVRIASAIQKTDGSLQRRDFSWAFQTKNDFRVLSTIPGQQANGVPIDTGIQFTMSVSGWEDVTPSFSITPQVKGRFEVHGRTLSFVPNAPLAPSTMYTVHLAQGWKVQGSSLALAHDVTLSFETSSGKDMYRSSAPVVTIDSLLKTSPNRDPKFYVYANDKANKSAISVTAYALTHDDAAAFLKDYLAIPSFAVETRKSAALFAAHAKTETFHATTTLTMENYLSYLVLPQRLAAGTYLLKIQPDGGDVQWAFVESTNLATYVVSDAQHTDVWLMNTETNRPLTNATVVSSKGTVTSDAQGIAVLPTPDALTSTTTRMSDMFEVNQGALHAFIILSQDQTGFVYSYGYPGEADTASTVSYLYADRPLYHTTDKLEAFGIAQDRNTHKGVGNVTLELTRSAFYDWYGADPGAEKVYRRVTLTTDNVGFFRGSMDWSELAPGWYSVRVIRDDKTVVSQTSFEIRDFVKPAYTMDVSTHASDVYGGDQVQGDVTMSFFNGTPLPHENVMLTATDGGSMTDVVTQHLTTDANGHVGFAFTAPTDSCNPQPGSYCSDSSNLHISVVPEQGEQSDIRAQTDVTVWRTRIQLDLMPTTKDGGRTIDISVVAHHLDLTRATDAQNHTVQGAPLRNAQVVGHVVAHTWDRTQDGTYYDVVNNRVSPKYVYTERNTDIGTFTVTTDAFGKATTTFTPPVMNDPYLSYRVDVTAVDEKGVTAFTQNAVYPDWSSRGYPSLDQNGRPAFQIISPISQGFRGYAVDQPVTVGFVRGDNTVLPKSDTPSFLYVTSHLGIRSVNVTPASTFDVQMHDADVPNMLVRGVMFVNGGFIEGTAYVGFDMEARKLLLTLTPNQSSYAPGAKAVVHVKAVDAQGKPAANARVALGAVDEALYAVAGTTGEQDPLGWLYRAVSDGVIFEQTSHMPIGAESPFYGGAERGAGGGGDFGAVRKNFKDTADFETATLDGNGEGDVTITLPDNLTRWRITGVALTQNLYAGSSQTTLDVTKPVFVDAVVPSPVLATDKPVIKLRAYGTGLKAGTEVTFTVTDPTLGLQNESVTGTAGTPVYVTVPSLPVGDHVLTIAVSSKGGSDAFEKHLTVLTSRFTKDELTQTELGPGTALPDPGQSREVSVQFLPKTRAAYLGDVYALASGFSQRVETQIGIRIADALLQSAYGQTDVETPTDSLSVYQQEDGGIAPLAYGSSDVELTSKVAAIAPQYFDKNAMADYLTKIAQDPKVTREQAIRAYSGLAALGQPVLLQLHAYATQTDLTWHEKLALVRGLDSAGDREAARGILADLLKTGEEHDGMTSLRVSQDQKDIAEATAEAAGLAADMGDDVASKLYAWVHANWTSDAMTDLDRSDVLRRLVPIASSKDVTIQYAVNGETKTTKLHDGYGDVVTLTADEVKGFRVVSVDGPAVAVMTRSVPGVPASSPDLAITRTYARADGKSMDDLHEGDVVNVTLTVTLKPAAPSGCFTVKDALPATMIPESSNYDMGALTTVYCVGSGDSSITYTTRVMSRGTYLAEPAIIQSMNSPSVAAVSDAKTIVVK